MDEHRLSAFVSFLAQDKRHIDLLLESPERLAPHVGLSSRQIDALRSADVFPITLEQNKPRTTGPRGGAALREDAAHDIDAFSTLTFTGGISTLSFSTGSTITSGPSTLTFGTGSTITASPSTLTFGTGSTITASPSTLTFDTGSTISVSPSTLTFGTGSTISVSPSTLTFGTGFTFTSGPSTFTITSAFPEDPAQRPETGYPLESIEPSDLRQVDPNASISVIIPVRNDKGGLLSTVASILNGRITDVSLELVIVDDASTDRLDDAFMAELEALTGVDVSVKLVSLDERVGVPKARNIGVSASSGEILFITDAHVAFSAAWDGHVLRHIRHNRVLAATIRDSNSSFRGYGCSLVVPFMGTHWNRDLTTGRGVQIAACAGTILTRQLFDRIGGYDMGMVLYGAAEPEFSLRAWLAGAEIVAIPEIEITHTFKTPEQRHAFVKEMRAYMLHNGLRFGMLYLPEPSVLQMVRHLALSFPDHIQTALSMLDMEKAWNQRRSLAECLEHDFTWFVRAFNLKDQIGNPILVE